MSDQNPDSKKKVRDRTNPLAGSPLFNPDSAALPSLPERQHEREQPEEEHAPATPATPAPLLLYNSPPSPEFIMRPFDKRHDRQTIYIDIRYAGALDALAKLGHRGNKTEMVNEMVEDLLKKHDALLRENEALVGLLEDQYRKKHGL